MVENNHKNQQIFRLILLISNWKMHLNFQIVSPERKLIASKFFQPIERYKISFTIPIKPSSVHSHVFPEFQGTTDETCRRTCRFPLFCPKNVLWYQPYFCSNEVFKESCDPMLTFEPLPEPMRQPKDNVSQRHHAFLSKPNVEYRVDERVGCTRQKMRPYAKL